MEKGSEEYKRLVKIVVSRFSEDMHACDTLHGTEASRYENLDGVGYCRRNSAAVPRTMFPMKIHPINRSDTPEEPHLHICLRNFMQILRPRSIGEVA